MKQKRKTKINANTKHVYKPSAQTSSKLEHMTRLIILQDNSLKQIQPWTIHPKSYIFNCKMLKPYNPEPLNLTLLESKIQIPFLKHLLFRFQEEEVMPLGGFAYNLRGV